LKIPEQLLRNSFWINCIQLGIPLLLWDLPALRAVKQLPVLVLALVGIGSVGAVYSDNKNSNNNDSNG
jgi:hypothetical protein